MFDSRGGDVRTVLIPDARLLSPACASYALNPGLISSSKPGHGGARRNSGGARPNSGGARENSGGTRTGAGRPRKDIEREAPTDPAARWYVVRTAHGETAWVDRELREWGYEVFAPTIFKAAEKPRRLTSGRFRPGKSDRVEYLFIRYIIVRFNLADPSWREILGCDGVERIISGGHAAGRPGSPIPVRDSAIDYVRQLLAPDGCIYPPGFQGGTFPLGIALVAPDGPMPDLPGICEMSDGDRVVMVMNLFNRDNVRVTVAQDKVRSV